MRLFCHFCHKSVSNEVPDSTIIRAVLICPECVEKSPEEIERVIERVKSGRER